MEDHGRRQFVCNVCGALCPRTPEPPGRETAGCGRCISTVRLRGLIALLSQELFGVHLALPDFPELKGLRAFGMSDPPGFAEQLAKKFDYTNTFYHQPPTMDITNPPESEWGRYDFIISSEVMEHVPPPVEEAFRNLHRLLKPNGLLLLTVPYGIGRPFREHFPELHEYALASPGGRTVLVNRRRDGSIEVFEDLCFHGGGGSTLELRVFNEEAILGVLRNAGFDTVRIAAESVPEFGVEHAEAWSLPIVARKGRLEAPVAELARAYGAALRRQADLERELASIRAEYERHIAFHNASHQESERLLAERLEWVRKTEALLEERTQWALALDKDYKELVANLEQIRAEVRRELDQLEARRWVRLGRKLRLL
jgi:SAM-dependent methyltransferase